MISETIVPTTDDLAPLLDEALEGRTEDEFVTGYLDGLAAVLKSDARQYRSYGPYWWPMKKMLIDTGNTDFGQELEQGTLQHYTMERPALTICAAWYYQQYQLDNGHIHTSSHQLDKDGGELYEYELSDNDIEFKIAAKDMPKQLIQYGTA